MGTTVVAAIVDGDCMTYASVGDSRIYSFADDKLVQLTRDDSWVAALRREGVNEAALVTHPMRHALTNAIGAREQTEVQLMERRLVHGERVVLCTDGVHDALEHRAIEAILRDCHNAQAAAEGLVRQALEREVNDNITALVLRYCGQPDNQAAVTAGRSDL